MKKWMRTTLLCVFAAVFLASATYLAVYLVNSKKAANSYTALEQIKEEAPTTPRPTINPDGTITPSTTPPVHVDVTDPNTGEVHRVLPEFKELYAKNNDIVGWLQVPGIDISYPVMQTPDRPNYYLYRNFGKEDSKHGCLYVQENCDVNTPSDNVIIYGHHMQDGSMFAKLGRFAKKDFLEQNPYIYFDTLTEVHTYQIVAVFTTTVTVGKGFAFYDFINAKDADAFNRFIDTCRAYSTFNTGVEVEYGDKLISLVTCEYSQINGRLVVVAKRLF